MSDALLMQNNSHNPGCMRRLPASHSCQPRSVQWISAAAAVCESPAASRAARTCSGVGFAVGPLGPRLGWLGINFAAAVIFAAEKLDANIRSSDIDVVLFRQPLRFLARSLVGGGIEAIAFVTSRAKVSGFVEQGVGGGHFRLLPLRPEARWKRCFLELDNTRIACKRKNYFFGIDQ